MHELNYPDMKNSVELEKVLFIGLEEGGKTSILLLLDRKFSLLPSVKPTIKAKRTYYTNSLLGVHITRWDLGGQKGYRKIIFVTNDSELSTYKEREDGFLDAVKKSTITNISYTVFKLNHKKG